MTASEAAGSNEQGSNPEGQDLAPVSGGAAAAAPPDTGLIKSTAGSNAYAGAIASGPSDASDPAQLAALAHRYLQSEVFGVQAKGTFTGKAHDLGAFVRWFEGANGRNTVWTKQDTVDFLQELERRGRACATINRALATLKAFAAWLYAQPGSMLQPYGLPTAGVGGLSIDPPTCRKLSDINVRRLLRAAHMLTCTRTKRAAMVEGMF